MINDLLNFYFVSLILLSMILLTSSGCLKVKELTDSSNMHKWKIIDIKLSEDSKRAYSLDYHNIKVWDLIGNRLILKQQWSDPNFSTMIKFGKLFVWNNGKKLFVTR